jgi:hypothetical protein
MSTVNRSKAPITRPPLTAAIGPESTPGERSCVAAIYCKWLAYALPLQVLDGSDQDGGFDDEQTGWCVGRQAAYWLARLIGGVCWGEAIDVDRERLREAVRRAAKFIVRRQAPDGRIDLSGTYSHNEAGFPVSGLVAAYKHLQIADPDLFGEVGADLKTYIQRACEAVLNDQGHTANHRWTAACAPLAAAHSLWPDERYIAKIEDYLSDGLDCDEDGFWYEERSPNYNGVANEGLEVIADCLNRPELLQPIVRNLRLAMYMLQPNGEMDSSYSHRQDRAQAKTAATGYGMARRIAQLTGDGRFTSLAMTALKDETRLIHELVPIIFKIEDHPEPLPTPLPLPADYERFYKPRQIARIRHAENALTLAADPGGHFYCDLRDQWGGKRYSDDWFQLHHGDVVVQSVHLAPAGGFAIQPRRLEQLGEGSYRLAGEDPGWTHTLHFRPGSPPLEMRNDQEHVASVNWLGNTLSLDLRCTAPHALVASLNLWIRPGVELIEGEGETPRKLCAGDIVALRGGAAVVIRSEQYSIRLLGLPAAQHHRRILPGQPIPSGMGRDCAVLCLGLRPPVELSLSFVF